MARKSQRSKRYRRVKEDRKKLTPEIRAWVESASLYVPNERSADGRDASRSKRMGDLG